jgi:hypothetical protein
MVSTTSRASLLKTLLLLVPALVTAVPADFTPPEETNVFSPPYCQANSDGFFGRVGAEVVTVSFNYQMELIRPVDDPQDVLDSVETSVANYVLTTSSFDSACGGRRRVRRLQQQLRVTNSHRRLADAVGLTVNPPDEVLPSKSL